MTMNERPTLGDFVRPGSEPASNQTPSPASSPAPAPRPAPAPNDTELLSKMGMDAPTSTERHVQERVSLYEEMQQALMPVTDYKKFLEKQNIPELKAARIVDDLLTKGYYEEVIELSKKHRVIFRTRERRDAIRLEGVLNARMPLLQTTIDEMIVRYNLAASLAEYNNQRYEFTGPNSSLQDTEQHFDVRMRVIEKLPDPVFYKLTQKLANFDRMVAAVMREGVAENF